MPRFSANLSMLFTEVPFLDRFALAAQAGFKAVEFWFPYEWPAAEVARRLCDHGLACVCLNAPPGSQPGDWGLAAHAGRRPEYLAGVRQACDYAGALGCPAIHVLAGMVQALHPDPLHHPAYLEGIALAAEQAAVVGRTVLIEPLNPVDRPGYLLWRQAQARQVVEELGTQFGAGNVRILYDLYHAQMTEGRLLDTLHAHLPLIGHLQVADVPGRHEPGTGEIHFRHVFDAIDRSGYAGWVGCEYQPRAGTAEGLGWRGDASVVGP